MSAMGLVLIIMIFAGLLVLVAVVAAVYFILRDREK